MNKLLLTASALVLGMGIASEAWADCNGFYLGARAGIVKHDMDDPKGGDTPNGANDFDKARFMMSGALGYRYNYVRAELEYVWRDKVKNSFSYGDGLVTAKQNFRTQSYMLNGYFDLAPYHWITPYVGAGIGYSKLKYSSSYSAAGETISGLHHDKNKFTWSVGGGLSVKVTNRFNVDAGYRYYDFGDLKQGDEKTGVKAHEFYGGVRYVF